MRLDRLDLQRFAVKVTHNTVSALGLAQEVFSKREARIDGGDGSITVQTAINEVFGIDFYSLNQAFMGVPAAPKKQAISLCEWAVKASSKGDVEEAGRALRAWTKKHGKGPYDKRLIEAPEVTYEDNEYLRSIGRL